MKEVVAYVVASHGYSQRRACRLTRQHRSTPAQTEQAGPANRDPTADARDYRGPDPLWLSTGPCDAEARRLDGWAACRLPAVPGGGTGFAD